MGSQTPPRPRLRQGAPRGRGNPPRVGPDDHRHKESVRVVPSLRGEGAVVRCEAAGSKKPEAYLLEYSESVFEPRTKQMASDRSPQ